MSIKTLLRLNNRDYTGMILTPFKVERNKLWGDDTGRVMSGEMKGTLVGIFPKLQVMFQPKTDQQLSELLEDLDSPNQTVQYYEARYKGMRTLGTYTNDYGYEIYNLEPHISEVTVSFIAVKKE